MKKLLFILMLISIVSNCLAQVASTTDLCNTEWVLRSPNCDGCKKFIAFTLLLYPIKLIKFSLWKSKRLIIISLITIFLQQFQRCLIKLL